MHVALWVWWAAFPAPEEGDLRKAKAYVAEVRKHLLESYLERERMSAAGLAAAALQALARGLKESELPEAERAAALAALAVEETTDGAFDALARAAPTADVAALADRVARAMVHETGDPFCRILTQEELGQLMKMMGGGARDASPGVALKPKGPGFEVAHVQAGSPADEEGVDMGDEVVGLAGRPAADLKPEDVGGLLRIPEGGTLELVVRRHGRDYALRLRAPKAPAGSIRSQALGRGVAYVRMTLFDGNAVREVEAALRALSGGGLRGIVLDLRRNPGGALPSATGVADLFLPQDLLIARTICHYQPSLGGLKFPGLAPPAEYKTRKASPYEAVPMVCLVDGGSASASELLAGALKDHRRAVLVGARTYGKGVGQSPIVLSSMFMKRYLYLTVLRYSTPHGDEVQHVGVAPDVEARPEALDAAGWDARWTLRQGGALERWLGPRWGPALAKAADWDGFETTSWEGFDDLAGSLATALPRDVLREELRRAARRRATEEGAAWACDLQADRVLQRGLVELLDRIKD
jgi:carboxyl-terminal processing protease